MQTLTANSSAAASAPVGAHHEVASAADGNWVAGKLQGLLVEVVHPGNLHCTSDKACASALDGSAHPLTRLLSCVAVMFCVATIVGMLGFAFFSCCFWAFCVKRGLAGMCPAKNCPTLLLANLVAQLQQYSDLALRACMLATCHATLNALGQHILQLTCREGR